LIGVVSHGNDAISQEIHALEQITGRWECCIPHPKTRPMEKKLLTVLYLNQDHLKAHTAIPHVG